MSEGLLFQPLDSAESSAPSRQSALPMPPTIAGGSCVFSGFLNYTPKISDGQAFADNTESAWLSENPVCFHPSSPILARDKGGQAAPVRYDGLAIRPTATQRIGTARSDAL